MREGQSLASIARGYRVSIRSLAAANAMRPSSNLRAGTVLAVPSQGEVILGPGQSLWTIAREHDCTVEELARANRITPTTTLQPGMRLRLPGKRGKAPARQAAAAREMPTRATKASGPLPNDPAVVAGTLRLYRIATREHLKLKVTDATGKVRKAALNRLATFLKPRNSKKQRRPETRLIALLAETSRHYEGRTIEVVSGYRLPGGYTSGESRHTRGAAMDIRIQGVDNRALCDYLRRFKNVGVGFYPNSLFVHLDVRDKNAYWIDLSSPGWKPSYLDKDQREHFDGKNKDEGLVELGRSIEAVLEGDHQAEAPAAEAPERVDE